jgi:hypothetical protein
MKNYYELIGLDYLFSKGIWKPENSYEDNKFLDFMFLKISRKFNNKREGTKKSEETTIPKPISGKPRLRLMEMEREKISGKHCK